MTNTTNTVSEPKSLSLTETQRRSYQGNGFLFPLRGIQPEKAADTVRRVRELERKHCGKGRDYVHKTLLRFKPHLLFPWLEEVVRSQRILDTVQDIIGPNILLWASALFVKEPQDPGYVAWHQDSVTYGLADNTLVTAWLALTDAHIENAAMRFIPASHKSGPMQHLDTGDPNNVLSRGEVVNLPVDESKAVNVVLDAGQMSLHHVDLLHSSPPNMSNRPRIGYAVRYMPTSMRHHHKLATAMLVRGQDTDGHFELEPSPVREDDPETIRAHQWAMDVRSRSVFATH